MSTPTAAEIKANIAKVNAEAEEKLAAAREHDANVVRAQAEAAHYQIMMEQVGLENRLTQIALTKSEREESFAAVSDLFHRTYNFDTEVNEISVKICISTLTAWVRQSPQPIEITIYIHSDGGNAFDGFALVDFLLELRRQGHTITTVALGWAASMAAVILQAGTTRVMGRNAFLLLHESSFATSGSYGEVGDRVKLVEKLQENIWELFASRAMPLNPKTTIPFIKKLVKRTDLSLSSSEALELGLVDEVR